MGLTAVLVLLGFARLQLTQPVDLSSDHIFLLQMIKDAMRGVTVFNEHLGAPLQKNGYYMPFFDGSYKLTIWLLTRLTSNVFLVVNLFYLVGVAATFVACFWSLRILDVAPWMASVASLAFVLTPYFVARAFLHDLLALYYSVPLGGALAIVLAKGDPVRKINSSFALAAVLVIGTSGLYYAFFSMMFIGLILVSRAIRERAIKPLLLCISLAVLLLLLLLLSAYGYHSWRWLLGGEGLVSPPHRHSWEQFYHGLLISSALHVYADLGLFVGKFAEYKSLIFGQHGLGGLPGEGYNFEWPGAFLTSIILISPALLFGFLNTRSREESVVALCLAFITFALLFSIRGGLGYVFGYLFIGAIRAQERIIPFLTFFAIVIACFGSALFTACNARKGVTAIVVFCLIAGVYPAVGSISSRQAAFLDSKESQAYRQSILSVLAAKDAHAFRMIFQLPVMPWPESAPVGKLFGYEHALPYIFDRNDSATRWSYGLSASEISPFRAMATKETELPIQLKKQGFDGILVEKIGYSVERAADLVETLAANGACVEYQDRFRALLSLCR
ncbi:hypothetical protein C7G41_32460 [Bradyrhizobium sp. MOS002]|nr:hypothetical protein C7G41_32460 [Bradyrhizobium sp. MOS002]